MRLREDALIGRLDPTADPVLRFVDLRGRAVELDDPARIGAIFHVRTDGTTPVRFREYVLCNEAMIERWSAGTEAISHRLDAETELLRTLGRAFSELPAAQTRWRAVAAWSGLGDAPSLASRWHATLAFDNVRYRPTPANVEAVARALADYAPTEPPLVSSADQASR